MVWKGPFSRNTIDLELELLRNFSNIFLNSVCVHIEYFPEWTMIVIQTLTRDHRKSQPLDLEVSKSSMDRNENKKKRGSSDGGQEVQDDSKRSCPILFPFPTG